MRIIMSLIACISLAPSSTLAHDFWLQPNGENTAGSRISISVHIGDNLNGNQINYTPGLVRSLVVYDEANPTGTNIQNSESIQYFGEYNSLDEGNKTFVMTTNRYNIKLSADEFNSYLEDEGMNQALEFRKNFNLLNDDAEENYHRIVKTVVGEIPQTSQVFGLPLELSVAHEEDREDAHYFSVKVTEYGNPIPNRQVKARLLSTDEELQRQRTDENGVAVFKIENPGLWAFATTSMTLGGGLNTGWESIWSSLTLNIDQ